MKEYIKKLQDALRQLGWKKNGDTWYIENGKYCFMIGFQKSNYSLIYYLTLSFTQSNAESDYNWATSYFKRRFGPESVKDGSLDPEKIEHINEIIDVLKQRTDQIKNVDNKQDVINFILTEIISPELGLNPRQKEQLEIIP